MKHRFKKIMSLTLCLALSVSIMSPVLAAENDATQTSPVKLTAQPIVFNVAVPSGLPVDVDAKGEVTVATNVKIENHSAAPISIAGVQVNPIVDWSIVSMNKDFKGTRIGTKEFGFILNNDEVPTSGTVVLTKSNWPSINGGSNLPLTYDSVVAPQKDAISGNKIADVVFTIGWDTSGFTLSSETLSIEKGGFSKLNLLGADSAVWSSSNESVATVDQEGNITGLDWGTSTITATANGVSKTCEVIVPKIQTGLEMNVVSKTIGMGSSFQLVATNKFRAGTVWTSSNPEIATVNDSGLVAGKAPGTTTITATQGEFSATCNITVEISVGTKYTQGNYEYSYGQSYGGSIYGDSSWEDSSLKGWGVKIIDNTQTSYVQPLEEIYGKPVVSYCALFKKYPNTSLTLEGTWTNTNVTNMKNMFYDSKATNLNLSNFNTAKVTNMQSMFSGSQATSIIGLSKFNTSKVTDMTHMFKNSQATGLNLSSFDTSSVYYMQYMFSGSQTSILDVSSFTTYNVTDMSWMFNQSKATQIEGLSSFNTSNVTSMYGMFADSQATSLDLSSFDTAKVKNMSAMFGGSQATTGYARTQTDADKFNASETNKPEALTFVVK